MGKTKECDMNTYKKAIIICFKQPFNPKDSDSIDMSIEANHVRELLMIAFSQIISDLEYRSTIDESTFGSLSSITSVDTNKKVTTAAHNIAFSLMNYLLSAKELMAKDRIYSAISIINSITNYVMSIMTECSVIFKKIESTGGIKRHYEPISIPS